MNGENYNDGNYLSLSGVGGSSLALESYLMKHGNIKHLFLHLDNDKTGDITTEKIRNEYRSKYYIFDKRVNIGKDINEYLLKLSN